MTLHGGEPRIKIKFARQVTTGPPTFALYVSDPSEVRPAHMRYLENRLRQGLGLEEAPIRLWLRSSRRKRKRTSKR
ncbi:MAG: hypothetical protein GF355_10570 [Candidatus Eisenbacteria bacterium]|nr:hypothetical protein [Candidatus Eisenbacteria bacterium]